MNIWIVNPFDQLPNETDVPLRYWSLCKTFAAQGHDVIWWSSDFSHLSKKKRQPCPPTDGFSVRLIETPPYHKNIGLARLQNHKAFGSEFYKEATAGLADGSLKAPNRIVISLPPLGVAEQAFKIRDAVKLQAQNPKCEVIVDIMDAWPEVLHQVLPKVLRYYLGPIVLAPLHRSAQLAYVGADKISGVGQSYLDLAKRYLKKTHSGSKYPCALTTKPSHLCYHGTDLSRFPCLKSPAHPIKSQTSTNKPLQAVYLGSMGSGYDLMPLIKVAALWKNKGRFPFQIHFAGEGYQIHALQAESQKQGLLPEHVVFHGQLDRDAVNKLLLASDLALVTNRPSSWVACPYKAAEYAAAGLPMISCLGGELGQLLREYNAGSEYKEGDVESLHATLEKYSANKGLLEQQASNARDMAAAQFDRAKTYREMAEFILG